MTIDEGRAPDETDAGGEITSATITGTAEDLAAIEADLGSV